MGVRPPQQDEETADAIEFGIAALAARLDDADPSFPAESDELVRELDDPSIPIDAHGRSVSLSTAFEEIDRRRFESQQELLNALHPVFEAYREDTSAGVLASIRALFPF